MHKHAPVVEWSIAESEADWERRCALLLPDVMLVSNRRQRLQRYLWRVVVLLLVLAGVGDWWWRTERTALPQPIAEVTATAQQEVSRVAHRPDPLVASAPGHQSDPDWWLQYGHDVLDLRVTVQATESNAGLDAVLSTVDFQGEQAIAQIITNPKSGAPAYRQTRFYRRTAAGWLRTEPDAALWGPMRSLETPFFVYHFRQHDAPAVIAVAPQIDALYTTMQRNFGLPISPAGLPSPFAGEKLVIDVSVTQPPGHNALGQCV